MASATGAHLNHLAQKFNAMPSSNSTNHHQHHNNHHNNHHHHPHHNIQHQQQQQQQHHHSTSNLGNGGGSSSNGVVANQSMTSFQQQQNQSNSNNSNTQTAGTNSTTSPPQIDAEETDKVVGYGAFGVVWSVTDPRSGRRVALKKMPNVFQTVVSAKRVFREVKMLCTLKHDNVRIF
jgi:nemo like kinase